MFNPSSLIDLENNKIDLWSIDPTLLSMQSIEWLSTLLSPVESDNILRYKNKSAKHTALITRAISRLILAQYTGIEPSALVFTRNEHGKPELAVNPLKIRFNLSHNNQQIIMAVCVNDDIGCDIEDPARQVSIETITRRFFAPQEHKLIFDMEGEAQQQRFFEVWTLKEAFVKAIGVGISLGLDTFYFENTYCSVQEQTDSVFTNIISVQFNENFPLNRQQQWYFYQCHFNQQMIAICRANQQRFDIVHQDAIALIKKQVRITSTNDNTST